MSGTPQEPRGRSKKGHAHLHFLCPSWAINGSHCCHLSFLSQGPDSQREAFVPGNVGNAPLNFKPQLLSHHCKLLVPKEGGEKRSPHASRVIDLDHQGEVGLLGHCDAGQAHTGAFPGTLLPLLVIT